jgi:phosphohistidine phosphatase SixA
MVRMGLRKGLSLIRGMKRSLTEEQQEYVAETIVHELKTANRKIEHVLLVGHLARYRKLISPLKSSGAAVA